MAKLPVRIAILIGLMLCTFAAVRSASRFKRLQVRRVDWEQVPYRLGSWEARNVSFNPLYGADPAESTLLRVYQGQGVSPIIVYAGFHTDLPTTLDYHTPSICYPAQGWNVLSENQGEVGSFRGNPVRVQEILVEKQGEQRLVTWWYHAGSRPFEKRIRQVYKMIGMALLTGRTDGTIVRVETPLTPKGEQAARDTIREFSELFLPTLDRALPQ